MLTGFSVKFFGKVERLKEQVWLLVQPSFKLDIVQCAVSCFGTSNTVISVHEMLSVLSFKKISTSFVSSARDCFLYLVGEL